jgi:hypothetical protein
LSAFRRASRLLEALHEKLDQFSGGLKADRSCGINFLDPPGKAALSRFRRGTEPYHEGCLHDVLRIEVIENKGMTVLSDFCDDSVRRKAFGCRSLIVRKRRMEFSGTCDNRRAADTSE